MFKRAIILFLWVYSLVIWPVYADEPSPSPDMSNLYSLITKQQGWLNTSRALTPDDLKGRIILLDFWTYACINCMHVIPDLQYLEEKFGSDLTVIGVHSAKFKNEGDSENIRQAIVRYGLTHPVVNDFDFSTWKAFGIHAWPTFLLINPKGLVEEVYSGEGNRLRAEQAIAALQAKYAGKINKAPLPLALEKDKQSQTVLSFPAKLAYGRYGEKDRVDALYISDSGHNRIVVAKVDGTILESIGSTQAGLKDGDFATAQFRRPQGLALAYPYLYVADTENHALRRVDLATRQVTTLAGNGRQGGDREVHNRPALEVALSSPWDITFYPDDQHLAIAMAGLHQLWSYDVKAKTLSVIAGNGHESIEDGHLPENALAQTSGLSALGGKLYFVDAETSSLRVLEEGVVTTLIGSGLFDFGYKEGAKGTALMQHPLGVFASENGIFVADSFNHSIRRFDSSTGQLSNFAGHGVRGKRDDGLALAEFNEPNALIRVGSKLYVADTNNHAIRVVDMDSKHPQAVTTLMIKELPKADVPEFSDALPNVEKSASFSVAGKKATTLAISLQKGWHINKDAPSYLALFDQTSPPKAIIAFDHEIIKSESVTLPALANGAYRLQGTLYYCEDKEGAQCLLKSFDVPVKVSAKGENALKLRLN